MNPERLEILIQDLCEGCINENDLAALEAELLANPESMQKYIAHSDLDNLISEAVETTSHIQAPVIPIERVLRRQKRKIVKWAGLAAAAMIALTLTLMTLYAPSEKDLNLMAFTVSPGSSYSISHINKEKPPVGSNLQIGSQLHIQQGAVELTFKSGVKSVILAPASITLTEANAISLKNGVAWFEVPEKAVGFKVQTKDFDVVDLGTEFGIFTNAGGLDELHVIKGKVQVTTRHRRKKSATLTTGQARRHSGVGGLDVIPVDSSRFSTTLPTNTPHLHWSFDNRQRLTDNRGHLSPQKINLHPKSPAVNLSRGKFGSALSIGGQNSHLVTDWDGILGSNPRTVSFWMKMPKSRSQHKASYLVSWGKQQGGGSSNNSKWSIFLNHYPEKKPLLNISFGGFWYWCPEPVLDDNQWHHIAVIYEGVANPDGTPATRVYVDGALQTLKIDSHKPHRVNDKGEIIIDTEKETPLQFGAYLINGSNDQIPVGYSNPFECQLDELYIIQGSISQEDVSYLMINNKLRSLPTKQLDEAGE